MRLITAGTSGLQVSAPPDFCRKRPVRGKTKRGREKVIKWTEGLVHADDVVMEYVVTDDTYQLKLPVNLYLQ